MSDENKARVVIKCLDHGFVRLVDWMGSDVSIVRAARVSHDAAWRAGEDTKSDTRLINYLWRNAHTSPMDVPTVPSTSSAASARPAATGPLFRRTNFFNR